MEGRRQIADKLEAGPLRRLEVLGRWMAAAGVDPALRRSLSESLEDLRDILLHLKASRCGRTTASEYWSAAWREVPGPVDLHRTAVANQIASLETVEMDTSALAKARSLRKVSSRPGGARSPEALPPALLADEAEGQGNGWDTRGVKGRVSGGGTGPPLRKPFAEHVERRRRPASVRKRGAERLATQSRTDRGAVGPRAESGCTPIAGPRDDLDMEFQALLEDTLADLLAS